MLQNAAKYHKNEQICCKQSFINGEPNEIPQGRLGEMSGMFLWSSGSQQKFVFYKNNL